MPGVHTKPRLAEYARDARQYARSLSQALGSTPGEVPQQQVPPPPPLLPDVCLLTAALPQTGSAVGQTLTTTDSRLAVASFRSGYRHIETLIPAN